MKMHRFHLLLGNSPNESNCAIWEDAGFVIHDSVKTLEERPDIIFWHHGTVADQAVDDAVFALIKDQLPKVWLTISRENLPWPTNLDQIYKPQQLRSSLIFITSGTKLEGMIMEPDWPAYETLGPLDEVLCLKAIANSVYTFLLEDVIQETADWCGHMSSALRPM